MVFCTLIRAKSYKFITTPIYYVNAEPHIGHLYTSLLADVVQRWSKLKENSSKIVFSTGTDEHGSKIQQAAQANATNPSKYCEKVSQNYRKLSDEFGVGYTHFVRTSSEEHKSVVRKFWKKLVESGNIYKAKYEGWYCVSDETFLTESQLKEMPNGKLVSLESGHPVEWSAEENYMFKLSQFQGDLIHWLKNNDKAVVPNKFHKMLLDWLTNEPLKDLSVSRPSTRVFWGIEVPEDPSQTIYVWLDALVNYLTCSGYETNNNFNEIWPPNVQVIGKDILKFHGIYWPSFLLAANLELPQTIYCHSHWTVDSEKMSKSKGNVVCPFKTAETYSAEGLRYFLLTEGVAHSDGNYSETKILRTLNSQLADTLGNLLSRCCGQVLNSNQEFPSISSEEQFEKYSQMDVIRNILESLNLLPETCKTHYNELNFYKVVDAVMATLHLANLFFETCKPWELNKQNRKEELEVVLHLAMETLRISGILLQPIVPELSGKILDKLSVEKNERNFEDSCLKSWKNPAFSSRKLQENKVILFERITAKKLAMK